jgi:hypothetical protein
MMKLAAIAATSPAASQASRGEPRDQARAQRHNAPRIVRSSAARREFQRSHPCPSTAKPTGACPGYVVDHPANMQWQTIAEARAKDRVE